MCLQCNIDLNNNVLWVGGGEVSVPFLQGGSFWCVDGWNCNIFMNIFTCLYLHSSLLFKLAHMVNILVCYTQKKTFHPDFSMKRGSLRKHPAQVPRWVCMCLVEFSAHDLEVWFHISNLFLLCSVGLYRLLCIILQATGTADKSGSAPTGGQASG